MQHFLRNIPPRNIVHLLSFISSTTSPHTTLFISYGLFPPQHYSQHHLFISSTTAPYTTSFIPCHLLPSTTLFTTSFTQIIYFPMQHYLYPTRHFFSLHIIIYFPIIEVNFRTVSTSQCAVFLPANTVTIAHSLNPDSDQERYL